MMKSEGTAANRMQTNGRKDLVNLQSTEAKGEIKMTNPQENNSEHKHNRQPKWIFAVVFIAAVVIICIATVLINRNSDKSTDGENSTAKTEENEPQSSENEQKEPAATQDPDNDTEAPDSQQPSAASAQTEPQSGTEAQPQETGTAVTPDASGTDMSGDYMGTIECPLPPPSSSYKCVNLNDNTDNYLVYVEHIDNANFRFYITKAKLIESDEPYYVPREVEEEVIFPEHIAHYNGDGYYEYFDDTYHLYFKYYDLGRVVADKRLEVYGLDSFFDPNLYHNTIEYNGMIGNTFWMGYPGVG